VPATVGIFGLFLVEASGKKDGRSVLVTASACAPTMAESFARSGLSSEMYLTGQCGFLFSKMFVNDKYTQRGLISSDMLTEEQIDYFLYHAAAFDINVNVNVKFL